MAVHLPPGILLLFQRLPRLLLPPATIFVVLRIYNDTFDTSFPLWLRVTAYVLSIPVTVMASVMYTEFVDHRAAAALGAVIPPRVASLLPGDLDIMFELVRAFKSGYMGEWLAEQSQINGYTFSTKILFERGIFTSEPEYVKAILSTKFDLYVKGAIFSDQVHSFLGAGVFNSDGDTWTFHRNMTRPFFSRNRISDFDIFDKQAEDVINNLKRRLSEGSPVDFQDMVSRFTLDSATEFLCGQDVCSLGAGLPYPPMSPLRNPLADNHPANAFAQAFSAAQHHAALRGRYGRNWRLFEFWTDKIKQHMSVCYQFVDPIIRDVLQKKESGASDIITEQKEREVKDGDTLLDHLVNYTEDHTMIRDETLNILLAGRDTTTGLLTFTIYLLSQHPDVFSRLREEVLSKVGTSKRPTYDDLREMKYMRAVLNETMRLYPPVPTNVRTSTVGNVLPAINGGKPFYVPANTVITYSVYLMHRRKDLWGPDALEFDPDRFIDERLRKYLTPNPFIFAPFNAGPRICPGQQFAYNEASYFLVRLLQSFSSVSLATDVQPPVPEDWPKGAGRKAIEKVNYRAHLTMYAEDGMWVRMEEAKNEMV